MIHPGAATLGALFPLALLARRPARHELLRVALGVESQLRVGIAMSPSHYDLGWHITGTCGVFGAAVAAGVLSRLLEPGPWPRRWGSRPTSRSVTGRASARRSSPITPARPR